MATADPVITLIQSASDSAKTAVELSKSLNYGKALLHFADACRLLNSASLIAESKEKKESIYYMMNSFYEHMKELRSKLQKYNFPVYSAAEADDIVNVIQLDNPIIMDNLLGKYDLDKNDTIIIKDPYLFTGNTAPLLSLINYYRLIKQHVGKIVLITPTPRQFVSHETEQQKKAIEYLKKRYSNIMVEFIYDPVIFHDREILLGNKWKFILSRGLDMFNTQYIRETIKQFKTLTISIRQSYFIAIKL